jgi:hypothetical protein
MKGTKATSLILGVVYSMMNQYEVWAQHNAAGRKRKAQKYSENHGKNKWKITMGKGR